MDRDLERRRRKQGPGRLQTHGPAPPEPAGGQLALRDRRLQAGPSPRPGHHPAHRRASDRRRARGALQLYVEDSLSERDRERLALRSPDEAAFRRALDEIRLFESLTGDSCGDKDDTLIHKTTWKVCRVDFSEAFPADPGRRILPAGTLPAPPL